MADIKITRNASPPDVPVRGGVTVNSPIYRTIQEAKLEEWVKVEHLDQKRVNNLRMTVSQYSLRNTFGENIQVITRSRKIHADDYSMWFCKVVRNGS